MIAGLTFGFGFAIGVLLLLAAGFVGIIAAFLVILWWSNRKYTKAARILRASLVDKKEMDRWN